jgi:hypothetical protein
MTSGRVAEEQTMVDAQEPLVPEEPRDAGLPPVEVTIEEVEPERLLANDSRDALRREGFTDDEIDDWAREFIAQHGAGETEDLMEWIRQQEKSSRRGSAEPGTS